jgi:transcriptional regulator with XRE-family HTH domain
MTTDKNQFEEIFSRNLKYLRKQKNLSQQQMAIKLRVKESRYQKWERAENFPNKPELLYHITEILEATLHDMMFVDMTALKNVA